MNDRASFPVEPHASDFAEKSIQRTVKRLFFATRPKFFPASVLPVLVGTAWGYHIGGGLDWLAFMLALVATMCVHAGANVLNDVGDEIGGSDRRNLNRIYPYTGGSRFIQAGILTAEQMRGLAVALFAAATLLGALLTAVAGPAVLLFGLAGLALGVLYSLPRVQLSARGIGEAAVAIAFGVLPVGGAAWLQSARLDIDTILVSVPVSMWVVAILLINEVPDIAADDSAGKRTLAVRLQPHGSQKLYIALHVVALTSFITMITRDMLPLLTVIVPLLLMALAAYASAGIAGHSIGQARLRRSIEMTLAIHTIGCLWLAGSILFFS